MHADVVRHLRCPVCDGALSPAPGALRCPAGHDFDLARQGYVNLLTGKAPSAGDSTPMITARAAVLAGGHFDFLARALAAEAAAVVGDRRMESAGGLVIDVGAGTGFYLAAVLDELPRHVGLAIDLAKPAARRAARAHPRLAAAVCDAWQGLPVERGCADVILNVFAPRNGAEFRRVLAPHGALLAVTPLDGHLGELVTAAGMIKVDPEKERRLDRTLGEWFRPERVTEHIHRLTLSHEELLHLVGMGPSARHLPDTTLAARIARLPEPFQVTAAVRLTTLRPR